MQTKGDACPALRDQGLGEAVEALRGMGTPHDPDLLGIEPLLLRILDRKINTQRYSRVGVSGHGRLCRRT